MPESRDPVVIADSTQLFNVRTRRRFLKALGAGGTIVLLPTLFAAYDDDDNCTGPIDAASLDLSDDTGILNYAYALEQLEAAFYSAVLAAAVFGTLSAAEQELFTDLRNHEVIHREFFRTVLGDNRIGDLVVTQAAVAAALVSRATVLRAAEQFEDLGVSAYNGAGKYLTNATNLLIAGKIVSVEARHASAIRDVRDAGTGRRFAGDDVVNAQGLDVKLEPTPVLTRADPFIDTDVGIGTPPTEAATADQPPPANI